MRNEEESVFFFEKKNQKTFIPLSHSMRVHPDSMNESLFASFSTEKEDFSFLLSTGSPRIP